MAPRNRLTQFLVKNLLLALLSLLLGFIAWWYLTNKVEGERRITLTLEYKLPVGSNFAPHPAIEQAKEGGYKPVDKIEVELRIRGLKDRVSALDDRALKLLFTVDENRSSYPEFQVNPEKMLVGLDRGLTAALTTPQVYRLNFARQFATQVTLTLDYNREQFEPRGLYYADWDAPTYDLSPRRLTVTGGEDTLKIPADHQLLLTTKKITLEPDDVKSGVWKRSGRMELTTQAEVVDAQNQHVAWVPVAPEQSEVAFEVTVRTRPETGSVKIPLQVLPPVDRNQADALDSYVLAEGAPREVTVQYSKPRRSPALMDSSRIFAFVNVTGPGNLNNLPISIHTTHNDSQIKIWLAGSTAAATGAPDTGALHASVRLIPADVGTTIRAQGPFAIRPIFSQQADRRYQVVIEPAALENLAAHGSYRTLGDRIGNDEISLLVEIPQAAFSGRAFDQMLPLVVLKPDRVSALTTVAGQPLPTVRVKLIPPALVPDTKPQVIGDVAVEVQYPQNFQMRLQLTQTKVSVSAVGAKDAIDNLRPAMLIAVVRPAAEDDRPEFTGKARVVGIYRKHLNSDGRVDGLETVPDVQFIPAEKALEFKTEKTNAPEKTQAPDDLFQPIVPADSGKKLPAPPPYGS